MFAIRRRTKLIAITAALLIVVTIGGYAYWQYRYPYGWSHCCDKYLYMELQRYTEEHNGFFPAGEATPEASLSLLYRQDPGIRSVLRGKTVPENVVKEILERGELLTPETCGWHYVEGLRSDDDRRLALFWDKAGLDHNGGRLSCGGHQVIFISGTCEHIPESKWQQFLAEQEQLLAERRRAK